MKWIFITYNKKKRGKHMIKIQKFKIVKPFFVCCLFLRCVTIISFFYNINHFYQKKIIIINKTIPVKTTVHKNYKTKHEVDILFYIFKKVKKKITYKL